MGETHRKPLLPLLPLLPPVQKQRTRTGGRSLNRSKQRKQRAVSGLGTPMPDSLPDEAGSSTGIGMGATHLKSLLPPLPPVRKKEFEQEQAEKAEGCFGFGNTDA